MALNKVEICGVNTSTLPVLDQEEKAELFKRIKAGDEEARELYIKGNLRLVLSVIRRFQNSSENPDDLFQIGCIGLLKAIDNFDTTLQVKFSTYAVPMIIGEIRRYLRDNNSIRVSRSLRDIAYKTIYTRENYMRQHLKEPTIAEIADEIGIDKEMIVYAMDAIQSPVSLFEPVYSEGGDTLYVMDQISDKKNLEENWVEDISLRDAMNRLGERERQAADRRHIDLLYGSRLLFAHQIEGGQKTADHDDQDNHQGRNHVNRIIKRRIVAVLDEHLFFRQSNSLFNIQCFQRFHYGL